MTDARRVALTFDAEHPDRPNDGDQTDAILAALASASARATFFLQGRWVEAFPDRAVAVAAAGHLVGNHSHYHARLPLFEPRGLARDVEDAARAIRDATGVDPRPWFRAPFGSGADLPERLEILAAAGYRHVGWHVSAEEWEAGRTADEVAAAVVNGVRAQGDGSIVLLHTWPRPVAPALPAILGQLGADGWRFVGVDELELPDGLSSIAEPQPRARAAPVGAS